MCVICIAEKSRPTPDQIEKMWAANPHGAGVSWEERGAIRWQKGLGLDKVIEFAEVTPLPYILHFRIPTAGGVSIEMLHPFELGGNCKAIGTTKRGVLFHNGHWSDHGVVLATLRAALQGRLPGGPWSDSRVMAYVSRYGTEWLDEIAMNQRICVQTPAGIETFGSWQENTKGSGLWFSNEGWRNAYGRRFRPGTSYRWNEQTRRMEEIPPEGGKVIGPAPAGAAGATPPVPGAGAGAAAARGTGPVVCAFPAPASAAPAQSEGAQAAAAGGASVAAPGGLIIEGPHPDGDGEIVWIREEVPPANLSGKDGGNFRKWNRFKRTKAGLLIQDNYPTAPRGLILLTVEDPVTQGWARRYQQMSDELKVLVRDDATGTAYMTPGAMISAMRESARRQHAQPVGPTTGGTEKPDVLGVMIDRAKAFFGRSGHEGAAEKEGVDVDARTFAD